MTDSTNEDIDKLYEDPDPRHCHCDGGSEFQAGDEKTILLDPMAKKPRMRIVKYFVS